MGWTQAQLAEHMSTFYAEGESYSHSTVAKTEAGSRPIRLNEAVAYAFLLREDLTLMLRGPSPETEITRHLATLQGQLRDLDSKSRDLISQRAGVTAQIEQAQERLAALEQRKRSGADRMREILGMEDDGVDREA